MSEPATGKMADLKARVMSALVLAAAILVITWWGGLPFSLVWAAAAIIVFVEFLKMVGSYDRWIALAGGTALALLALLAPMAMGPSHLTVNGTVVPALLGALTVGAAAVAILGRHHRHMWALAAFLYAAVLAFTPPFLRADPYEGMFVVLAIYGLVWGTDIGAYFAGRAIGGPKLWPRVSPKKTWSGLIGGVICGVLLAWLFLAVQYWLFSIHELPTATVRHKIILTVFFAITAAITQLGDLMESALKRKFNVKDASQLIPGHGGLMDRLDGFWAACVVMLVTYAVAYGF
ncbi:MAG: phosphatidate cytidylyltransferase [Beijerinckiaceae bacterium]